MLFCNREKKECGSDQPYDGNLHQVIENVTAVVKSIPIGNFENNSSSSSSSGTQHQRNGVVGSDDVRMDGLLQHAQSVIEVARPKRIRADGRPSTR